MLFMMMIGRFGYWLVVVMAAVQVTVLFNVNRNWSMFMWNVFMVSTEADDHVVTQAAKHALERDSREYENGRASGEHRLKYQPFLGSCPAIVANLGCLEAGPV